jgi:hypothetical protein
MRFHSLRAVEAGILERLRPAAPLAWLDPSGSLPNWKQPSAECSPVTYFSAEIAETKCRRGTELMNTQKHFQLIRRAQRWIAVLSGVVLLAVSTYAQESASKVSIVAPSQTAPEAAHKRCKTAVNCFDAGAYIVTVTDIIEGDIPNYRRARLALVFDNLTDETLVLAYGSGSSVMVDNFKNRYSCCQTDSSKEDTSAIGIGIDREDKVSSQFRLNPRASDSVSFDLWRHRPPDLAASHYHVDLMIEEVDPSGKTVLKHTVVFFRNLPTRAPEEEQKK